MTMTSSACVHLLERRTFTDLPFIHCRSVVVQLKTFLFIFFCISCGCPMLTLFPLVTLSIKDKTDSHCCILLLLLFSCYCPQIRRRRLLFFSSANLAESKVAVEKEREGVAEQQEGEETAAHVTVVGVSTFFSFFYSKPPVTRLLLYHFQLLWLMCVAHI